MGKKQKSHDHFPSGIAVRRRAVAGTGLQKGNAEICIMRFVFLVCFKGFLLVIGEIAPIQKV